MKPATGEDPHDTIDSENRSQQTNTYSLARRNPWGNYSYKQIITRAITSSANGKLTLSQIYQYMIDNYEYFKERQSSPDQEKWKNSVRHNLSLHECFVREQLEGQNGGRWTYQTGMVKKRESKTKRDKDREKERLERKNENKKRSFSESIGGFSMHGFESMTKINRNFNGNTTFMPQPNYNFNPTVTATNGPGFSNQNGFTGFQNNYSYQPPTKVSRQYSAPPTGPPFLDASGNHLLNQSPISGFSPVLDTDSSSYNQNPFCSIDASVNSISSNTNSNNNTEQVSVQPQQIYPPVITQGQQITETDLQELINKGMAK